MEENIKTAEIIRNGGVVLLPTDTNYALATDPWNTESCARLYAIKRRDHRKPLTLFIAEPSEIYTYVDMRRIDEVLVRDIVDRYWPGALNIVLPKSEEAPINRYFEDKTISIVCNKNKILRSIITALGKPLGLSSANISGTDVRGLVDFNLAFEKFSKSVDYSLRSIQQSSESSRSSTIISIMKNNVSVLRQGDIIFNLNEGSE